MFENEWLAGWSSGRPLTRLAHPNKQLRKGDPESLRQAGERRKADVVLSALNATNVRPMEV